MDRLRCSVATSRTAVRVRAEVAVRHRRMVTEISGCRQLRPTAATARRSCSRRVRLLPVADGQVDRPRGARRQWDGHDLAALRVIVSVRCPRSRPRCSMSAPVASDTGSPFSASREISACSHDGPSPAARRARCGPGRRRATHSPPADGGRARRASAPGVPLRRRTCRTRRSCIRSKSPNICSSVEMSAIRSGRSDRPGMGGEPIATQCCVPSRCILVASSTPAGRRCRASGHLARRAGLSGTMR